MLAFSFSEQMDLCELHENHPRTGRFLEDISSAAALVP